MLIHLYLLLKNYITTFTLRFHSKLQFNYRQISKNFMYRFKSTDEEMSRFSALVFHNALSISLSLAEKFNFSIQSGLHRAFLLFLAFWNHICKVLVFKLRSIAMFSIVCVEGNMHMSNTPDTNGIREGLAGDTCGELSDINFLRDITASDICSFMGTPGYRFYTCFWSNVNNPW